MFHDPSVTQTNMHLNAINGTDKLRVPLCLTSSGTLISSPLLAPQQVYLIISDFHNYLKYF